MDSNGESEMECLLDDKEEDKLTNESVDDDHPIKKNVVKPNEAFYIMVGFTLGTAILVMPFIVRDLGIVLWLCFMIGVLAIDCFCTYILKVSTQHLLEQNYDGNATRDAYQAVAELSGGPILRNASVLFMYVSHISICIALLLVAGSILADIIPIGSFSYANHIRIWTTIIIIVLTPIMYLGTYSDVKVPAIIALVTSLCSAIAITVNCILAKYMYKVKVDEVASTYKDVHNSFLIHLGTIFFVSNGATLTIPNLTVLSSEPKKLLKSVIACYVTLFFVFLLAGLVPYFVFGDNILPSITSTFDDVIRRTDSFNAFGAITIVIQLLMILHMIMASILSMNPCFLHQEECLNIPHEFSWKRIMVRTSYMLIILGICILIPEFEFCISIAGGVPLTFTAIILPLIIYLRLFEMSRYKKILGCVFVLVFVVFAFCNLAVSIKNLFSS